MQPEPVYDQPRRRSVSPADDDDDQATRPSVSQLAANIAHRVNSFITPAASPTALPSDAELEAQAMRERDRSRREAEWILTREAEQRRATTGTSPQSLPPPARARSQTLPDSTSPANSAKDAANGWWAAAKSRLTPTKDKEPLTPAQQLIQDVKARDKDKKKTTDQPTDLGLKLPQPSSSTTPTTRTPVRLSPQPATHPPINLSPISLQRGTSPGGSPAREQPPLYASFTPSGSLDVPGTLLVIARRFEKLERWSVSHVRALEERMGDVERWLVERENERAKDHEPPQADMGDMGDIRDEVTELRSQIGELGREMARFATSSAVLSSRVEPAAAEPDDRDPVGAVAVDTPRRVASFAASETTSPPLARVVSHRTGTRLPYPTGDYASPDIISPTHTPASSPPPVSGRPPSMVIAALPRVPSPLANSSPPARVVSPTPTGLSAPNRQNIRRGSISPTPMPAGRKRYTVALGGPIVAPPEIEAQYARERERQPATAESSGNDDDDDDSDVVETVGRKAASRVMATVRLTGESGTNPTHAASPARRTRAQSTCGGTPHSLQANSAHRLRSQSTDFRSDSVFASDPHPPKFVDPLTLRRQEKSKETRPSTGPGKKVPFGELVAFFNSERGN